MANTKKFNKVLRDKNWKRKPTALSRKKRLTPGRPSKVTQYIHKALQRAKQESYNVHKARIQMKERHRQNLDAILASNGLQRKAVDGDGNCQLKAVHMSTDAISTPEILRKKLCDHLSENQHTLSYIEFLPSDEHASDDEKTTMYTDAVNFLREEGHWSNGLADAMPLAIANVLKRTLKIYCSNRSNPVYEIQPNLLPKETTFNEKDPLSLAFFQVPGFEHYDACIRVNVGKHAEQSLPLQRSPEHTVKDQSSTSLEHSETVHITPRKQAKYQSPEKSTKRRKRVAQPDKWKKNIRKRRCIYGLEYINTT